MTANDPSRGDSSSPQKQDLSPTPSAELTSPKLSASSGQPLRRPLPPVRGSRGPADPSKIVGSARRAHFSTQGVTGSVDTQHQMMGQAAGEGSSSFASNAHHPSAAGSLDANTKVEVIPASADPDFLPPYSYRSPEAVVEHIEDSWESNLPPGVLAEHLGEDDSWGDLPSRSQHVRPNTPVHGGMDVDPPLHFGAGYVPERPQIGSGLMAGRLLKQIHEHAIYRPVIADLPAPLPRKEVPEASQSQEASADTSESDERSTLTIDDVKDALPGAREGCDEWYFCPKCWAWLRIAKGHGVPDIPPMEEFDSMVEVDQPADMQDTRSKRQEELSRLRDLCASRETPPMEEFHFHVFTGLVAPTAESRVARISAADTFNKFAHLDPTMPDPPGRFTEHGTFTQEGKLWMSCTSDAWLLVDKGPVPGQIPVNLVREWTTEKQQNPNPGQSPPESVVQSWNLIITLLQNPLFRGNRGWVKMTNPTFLSKIGATLTTSHLMYQIGFACIEEEGEGYRVGPFKEGEGITKEQVEQMNRYMIRTWVEVTLALQQFQRDHRLSDTAADFVKGHSLEDDLRDWLQLTDTPSLSIKFEPAFALPLALLGVTDSDSATTIEKAYELQISDDYQKMPRYLSALEKLSSAHVPGRDALQLKVATERSLDRYTIEELDQAYARIGITPKYVQDILVDREDIPDSVVLDKHRDTMSNASDSSRGEIGLALSIIGKSRNNFDMIQLARKGGVHLSVDQAYQEFNITRGEPFEDDMVILQYESCLLDRPGRSEHYRTALSIVANAPGEERPVLQAFLEGKDISEFQAPARRDIPTGLRNIGNTCYLNSVLQFLYTVKPVRDAVMTFEETVLTPPRGDEPAKEIEKIIKVQSSRHFVAQLRDLFKEMYCASTSAVVPKEELARLAILPVDLLRERKEAMPLIPPKTHVNIDSLPTVLSPDSTISSGAATIAGSSPPSTPPDMSPRTRPEHRDSVLGKRASHDRDSAFGGSDERLPRLSKASEDLISFDSDSAQATPSEEPSTFSEAPTATTREDSELPDAGLSLLGITSPVAPDDLMPDSSEATTRGPMPTPRADGPPPLPPRRRSMALVAAEKFGLQQDAAEILINVLAQLEYALETSTEEDNQPRNLISSLFSSKFRQQMLLESADGVAAETHAPVESVFVHPIIGVEEDGKDLYDCLSELYLGGAEIEYEGKKGFKMDLIDELPPMLYIQMRRSQYDAVKQSQTKTNTHVPFDRTLVMDRFLTSADPVKRERSIALTRDIMRMRARHHELKNHKPLSIPETFQFMKEYLAQQSTRDALAISGDADGAQAELAKDVDDYLLGALGAQSQAALDEISDLEAKIPVARAELDRIWEDQREVEYELVSVFVHGGTGTGGHYWTYQANLPTDGNKFFYYSDEVVKEVPASDVFADQSSKGVSPALLCYVRKNRDIVYTLHREPEVEVAVDEAGDVGMEETAVE